MRVCARANRNSPAFLHRIPTASSMSAPPDSTARRTQLVVGAILVAALALRSYGALTWHLGFDEYWVLYFARLEPFTEMLPALRTEEHPPLCYLLSRLSSSLGQSPWLLRLHSIVAGVLGVYLCHRIANELGFSAPLRVLAPFLAAFSWSHTVMSSSVRAYILSDSFTLVAFYFFLNAVRDPASSRRQPLLFACFGVLGAWTEYNAAFPIAAMVGVLVVVTLLPANSGRSVRVVLARWWPALLVLAIGLGGLVLYYRWTVFGGVYPPHLLRFLPAEHQSFLGFAMEGLAAYLTLLMPVEIAAGTWLVVLLLWAVGATVFLASLYLKADGRGNPARASVVLIPAFLLVGLFALALAGRYPFGGFLRQQFFLFSFVAFFGLCFLDEVCLAAQRRLGRWASNSLIVAAFACSAATSLSTFLDPAERIYPPRVVLEVENRYLRGVMRDGEAVYASTFGLPALYAGYSEWTWRHRRELMAGCNLLDVSKGRESLAALWDYDTWTVPQLPDGEWLSRLARLLKLSNRSTIWIYGLTNLKDEVPVDVEAHRASLEERCREYGFDVVSWRLFEGSGQVYRLRLRG